MTNQNDTQDEAERLAKIWADEHYPHSRTYQTEGTNGWHGFIAGYRAGVASKEAEIADLKVSMDECFAKTREMIREASKAKTRDSFLKANIELSKELAAEKQKAQKLVEALEIFLDDLSSGPKLSKVTEALANYSTDSGDGSGKRGTNK